MKAQELADILLKDPTLEVMILDGFNGGGEPRDINLGPTEQVITQDNADEGADCEGKVGQKVLIIGYGCY